MAPKRTSTSAVPAINQATIRKLVADSVVVALEAQAATMANPDNTNRNTGQGETLVERKCSYKEFMSCQPFNFKGTQGVFGLIHWFERTESVISRNNCTEDCKVKFATGTLTEEALTWWNSFAQPIRIEEGYKITWSKFKKCLIKKNYPRTEIKKMEDEFYNLTVKGNDLKTYIRRFQELAVLCPTMVPNSKKLMEVTKHNSVQGTNDHKRKFDDRRTFTNRNNNNRNNDHHQQQNRRKETLRAYTATPTENSGYVRNFPLHRTLHYQVSYLQLDGEKGHYRNQCPKANNSTHERAYLLRDKNAHQDPNVVTGMFLLNQHLARVLFDSGADKSFVSISLASMLNIPPVTLDTTYDIKIANGNLVDANTVIQGCTLILLNQPFEIDLMPIKLGSFDVVIGMDWLSKYHARIICDEKVVHMPIDGETLIIRAQVMEKKSDEKRLEDLSVVREFLEVFPEDLPDLPPVRQRAEKERDELKLILEKLQNSSKSLNTLLESQRIRRMLSPDQMRDIMQFLHFYRELHAPPKHDLRLIDKHFKRMFVDVISNITPNDVKTVDSKHKTVDVNHMGVFSIVEPKPIRKNSFSPPIIEDWHSDDEINDCLNALKRVMNRVDKVKGGSSGADNDGFIEVKKKKSGDNNEGTKNFKPVSVKPKTIYHPKVNQPTEEASPKMAPSGDKKKVSTTCDSSKKIGKTNALSLDFNVWCERGREKSTYLVENINVFEQQLLAGKCLLLDDKGKPLKMIDYTGDHDSENEVEPVDNEMESFLVSKPSTLDDMYEGQEIPDNIQSICDNLNIKIPDLRVPRNFIDRLNEVMNPRRRRNDEDLGNLFADDANSDDEPDPPRQNLKEDDRRWESGMRVNIPEFDGNTLNPEGFIDWLRIMTRLEERLNQFADQLADRLNEVMNPRRRRNDEDPGNLFADDANSDDEPDPPRQNPREDDRLEEVFEFKEVPEKKRVSLIATKLRCRASAWWQQLKLTRERVGKSRVTDWVKMKKLLRENFIPHNYQLLMYQRLQNLKQGTKSETEDQLVSRYIGGLRVQIMEPVNLFDPVTLSDAHQRTLAFEKQNRRFGSSSSSAITRGASGSGNKTSRFVPNQTKVASVSKGVGGSNLKCFNCGEPGHRQSECQAAGKKTLFIDMEENDEEPEYEEEYVSGDVGVSLVVRRSCLTPKADGDNWLSHNIYQSTCTISGKVCTFVCDSGSCDNLIAAKAVQKLELKTEDHPKPYKLQWLRKGSEMTVSKRVHVTPWEYDRAITHNGRANTYSFLFDGFGEELEVGDDVFVLIGKEVAKDSEIPKTMIPLLKEFFDIFLDELPDGLPPLPAEAVQKLELKTEDHPKPYKLQWLRKGSEMTVSKRVHVTFSVGKTYKDNFGEELEVGDDVFVLIGKEVTEDSEIPKTMIPLLKEFSDIFLDE
nr:hypothetical protein [Tanacetum cinerariifolium]